MFSLPATSSENMGCRARKFTAEGGELPGSRFLEHRFEEASAALESPRTTRHGTEWTSRAAARSKEAEAMAEGQNEEQGRGFEMLCGVLIAVFAAVLAITDL